MAREICFGKNISLKASNIQTIQDFQNKTKKNFSATLNIIVEQWDEFSLFIQKLESEKKLQKDLNYLEQQKKAKVIEQ